jgi:hypothetical protein
MKTSAKNMSTNNKIFIQLSNEAHSMIEIQNDWNQKIQNDKDVPNYLVGVGHSRRPRQLS